MAAANPYIYIYIGQQGAPTILNVDNETDGAVLEQLGAVKMPESMAAEIFGENAQYADNTNTTVTSNPDTPEFPYTIVFDSSKILEKPKRELGTMASIGAPSDKYIDIELTKYINPSSAVTYYGSFIAPADGYIFANGTSEINIKLVAFVILSEIPLNVEAKPSIVAELLAKKAGSTNQYPSNGIVLGDWMHVQKGHKYYCSFTAMQNIIARFYYPKSAI